MNSRKNEVFCAECGDAYRLTDLLERFELTQRFDLDQPPRGATIHQNALCWELRGSNWRWRHLFVLAFGVVMFGSFVGQEFPQLPAENRSALWLWIGLVPVLFLPLLFCSVAIVLGYLLTFGGTTVHCDGKSLTIFEGAWPIRRTRRIPWNHIRRVEKVYVGTRHSSTGHVIELRGQTVLYIGRWLNLANQHYVLDALRSLISPVKIRQRHTRARSVGS
ncbi:MAG: hypothetical protein Q8M16_13975 [Pirellulaceae bacterium]|nr:hypothetical protein [Pirellulaceae bacterium]